MRPQERDHESNPMTSRQTPMTSFQVGHGLAFLTVLLSLSTGSIGQTQSEATESGLRVGHSCHASPGD